MSFKLIALFIAVLAFPRWGHAQTENLTLYNNAEGMPLLELLKAQSIDIEIYTMTDPDVRAAIRAALDRNARVRIIAEPKPMETACPVFSPVKETDTLDCKDQKSLVTEVNARSRQTGSLYAPFNKAALCAKLRPESFGARNGWEPCFEHGKMVITNGDTALVSTGNFDASNLCDKKADPTACNRDYSLTTTDSAVVKTLTKIFESDLKATTYDLAAVVEPVKDKLTVSPLSLDPLVAFIASAKETIQLENQYVTDFHLNEALIQAAKNNVKVQVMVESVCYFGKPTPSQRTSTTKIYSQFDAAGIKSKFFTKKILINGKPGYLHAKAIVVDGKRAWVGSVNGSTMALTKNREFGLFFDTPTEVQKLLRVMDQDWNQPSAETWQESLDCKLDAQDD